MMEFGTCEENERLRDALEKISHHNEPDYKRKFLGGVTTVGELEEIASQFSPETGLAVRNAPLPNLYELTMDDGQRYLEIELSCFDGAMEPVKA